MAKSFWGLLKKYESQVRDYCCEEYGRMEEENAEGLVKKYYVLPRICSLEIGLPISKLHNRYFDEIRGFITEKLLLIFE